MERARRLLLYSALAIWLVYQACNYSFLREYRPPFSPLEIASAFVWLVVLFSEVCKIWRDEYGRYDAAALAILVPMAGNLALLGQVAPFTDALLVFAFRGEDYRKALRFATATVTAMLLVVITCSQCGILQDVVWYRGPVPRHALGFSYCLDASQVAFTVTCAVCWLRGQKVTWTEIAVLFAGNVALFIVSDSRLSFACSMAVLAAMAVFKLAPNGTAWSAVSRMASWGFIAVAAVSILLVAVYALQVSVGADWLDWLDLLVSSRIKLTYDGVTQLGWHPFGQNVAWRGAGSSVGDYNYVDNLFFHALVQHGAVYALGLFALYTAMARKAAISGDTMVNVSLGVLAIHFLLDDLSLVLFFNPMLVSVGAYLFSGSRRDDTRPLRSRGRHAR